MFSSLLPFVLLASTVVYLWSRPPKPKPKPKQSSNNPTLGHGRSVSQTKIADQKAVTLEKELGALIWQHKTLKDASEKHMRDCKRVVDEKTHQLAAMESGSKNLLTELHTAREKARNSDRLLSEKVAELVTKELRIKELLGKIKGLEGRLKDAASATKELRGLQEAYGSLKKTSDAQLLDLQRLIAERNSGLERAEADKNLRNKVDTFVEQASETIATIFSLLKINQSELVKAIKAHRGLEALQKELLEMGMKAQQQSKDLLTQVEALSAELEREKANTVKYRHENARNAQDFEQRLAKEQQTTQHFKAENVRLTYQLATDKGAFEAEKKSMRRQVNDEKAEVQRLEQEASHLAGKVMAAERELNDLRRNGNKLKEDFDPFTISEIPNSAEEPNPIIYRNAPFDYTVISRPPCSVPTPDKKQGDVLDRQIKIYQVLLECSNKNNNICSLPHHVNSKLVKSGLHKDHPVKSYVSPQYYSRIETFRELSALTSSRIPNVAQTKPQQETKTFELDHLEMLNREDLA